MSGHDDSDHKQRREVPAEPEVKSPEAPSADAEEEDFATMFEESLSAEPASYDEGDTVEGRVVSVGSDVAFIDVGGKGEATIDLEELQDEDGEIDVEVGDIVQAIVVSTAGGLKLSHRLARGAATRERLAAAFAAGIPVEGRVEKSIKGGYDVRVAGQRAFCPISQIDKAFTEDPSIHAGQVYVFRILEYKEDGKNMVVSRRAVIEEEEREQAEVVRRTIVPGAELSGQVASVLDYGAFVDLGGGIQGLLHVSEMGWSRMTKAAEVVRPGDEITVKVLRVDDEKGRISLGLKQLQADPWSKAEDTYGIGQVLMGKVTRIAEFGAFVELQPGIEGLAHANTFSTTGKQDSWKATVPAGSAVAVEILSFDPEKKRIGVAVVQQADAEERKDARDHEARQDQETTEGFGSLADKLRAAIKPGD